MWIDRNIRGPQAEHLTPSEVARELGITEDYLDDRIADGTFPPPVKLTQKSKFHPWEHVVFMSLWLRYVQPVKQNLGGK